MKKFRLYFDKDKEEEWLNQMVDEGWAMKSFFLGMFTFEPCEPGEYIYRTDLLWSGGKGVQDYAEFLEDTGVEIVDRWFRWIFLRRKTSEGPFELYTDLESKIANYQHLARFYQILLVMELLCVIMELINAIRCSSISYGVITVGLAAFALVIFRLLWKCKWKIEELQKQSGMSEKS